MLTALMYHFVHSAYDDSVFRGIPGLSVEQFEDQVKGLLRKHDPVQHTDLVSYFDGSVSSLPQNGFYLTFDEGIKQHITSVLPILQKYEIKASFFIPTKPLTEGHVSIVEKQRVCQYSCFQSYVEFLEIFYQTLRKLFPEINYSELEPTNRNIAASGAYLREYTFYSNEERFYRKIRDRVIAKEQFEQAIDAMFLKAYASEKEFIKRYYLDWSEISELKSCGMEIGGHSHSHPLMTRLSREEIVRELNQSFEILQSRLGEPVGSFAYPFGAYNELVLEAVSDSGARYSFTTLNESNIFPLERHEIRRIDSAAYSDLSSSKND